MDTIAPEVKTILESAEITEKEVKLTCGVIERALYVEVDVVLKRCGGKWNSKTETHKFERGTEILQISLDKNILPPKNPLAFFPTPSELVDTCIEYACIVPGARVLEPSAGSGAFLRGLQRCGMEDLQIDAIELDPFNAAHLRKEGFEVHEMDFMHWKPDYKYDRILMNPPFSVKGDNLAYITHFLHAYEMLDDNGIIVLICPPNNILTWQLDGGRGARARSDNAKIAEFQTIIEEGGHVHPNPKAAFKESGTYVDTVTVVIYS